MESEYEYYKRVGRTYQRAKAQARFPLYTAQEIALEVWRDCPLDEGVQVSNLGRIRNRKTREVKTLHVNHSGYAIIGSGKKTKAVAVLVFAAWHPDQYAIRGDGRKWEIDHANGDKLDNRIGNLRLLPHARNVRRLHPAVAVGDALFPTVAEAARGCRVSTTTMREWIRKGKARLAPQYAEVLDGLTACI